ncbi:MAG: CoA ester lyase [Campylobacterales bacterium]|nr:CoA ester lyase [Campylobacterales bacterium]
MIFEDISRLKNLSNKEIKALFGNIQKSKTPHPKRGANMMLNPLKLEHLNRLDELEVDMITINLEDAIAPQRKKEALYNTALFLSHLQNSKSFIIVRINELREGGVQEIQFLNNFSFDAIRLPKVKNSSDVAKTLDILDNNKELHLSLETKEAFNTIGTLKIDSRVTTLNLGILDLLASLDIPQDRLKLDNPSIEYILAKFLIESKSACLHPISFMYQDYNNLEEFSAWCKKERLMGYESKACMGPKQVAIAQKLFAPSLDALHKAKTIKELFEQNSKKGIHGFMHEEYGFIDEPIYKDALNLFKKYSQEA